MSCSLAVSCVFIAPNQTNKCGSCGTCSRPPLLPLLRTGWRAKHYATQCAQIAQSNYQQQQQQQGVLLSQSPSPLPQVELRQSIIMLACNRNNCSPQGGARGMGGKGRCHWGLTLQKSLLEPGLSLVAVVVSLSTGQPFGVKDERVTATGGV